MTLGLAFWIIMLVWFVWGIAMHFGYVSGVIGTTANVVLLFILFLLLGWQVFGAPLRR
jgi:hypothetical protein